MIRIRQLTTADVNAVLAIEEASPEAAAWNRQAYEAILAGAGHTNCLVAELEQISVGFVSFRIVEREAELLNLAVLPAFRRRGIGARLLEQVFQEATRRGALEMFLEVRDSNPGALGLYERFGFKLQGRRRGYYSHPPADALVLHRSLPSPLADAG
jgi:ribosomal-protein-alanine N-acetyltransferase